MLPWVKTCECPPKINFKNEVFLENPESVAGVDITLGFTAQLDWGVTTVLAI